MTEDTAQEKIPFDRDELEAMNAKAVENQFFTPDHVYLDLMLLKDIPLGVVYGDQVMNQDEASFVAMQQQVMTIVHDYQKRPYETVDPYLKKFGYDDEKIKDLLKTLPHDVVFSVAPTTTFFETLIRHTIRNQNNSGPANKYTRKSAGKKQFTLEAIPVTYYINTYPLTLSKNLLDQLAPELGESFGVNIQFLNKDPALFDQSDWDDWAKKIECFYLNNLGRFTRGEFIKNKFGEADGDAMAFAGVYMFARKRFETEVMAIMAREDFTQQVQWITTIISVLCDFQWLQNNDCRLTEDAEDVPMESHEPA